MVGRKAVVPVAASFFENSGTRPGSVATSTPNDPFTCRSTKPGAIRQSWYAWTSPASRNSRLTPAMRLPSRRTVPSGQNPMLRDEATLKRHALHGTGPLSRGAAGRLFGGELFDVRVGTGVGDAQEEEEP